MKISARLLSVCCALSVSAVPPTVHGDAALDAAFAPLAGVREHSGRLIVRPKQVDVKRNHDATPIVSGAAALMWSATPTRAPEEIEAALLATARDLGEPGEVEYFGVGLMNAFEALKVTLTCPADAVSEQTLQPPGDGVVDAADLAFLLSQWGPTEQSLADVASSASFALPADGLINAADLGFLLGMWGECP